MKSYLLLTCCLLALVTYNNAATLHFRAIDNTLYSKYLCLSKQNGFQAIVPGSCSQYYQCQNGVSMLMTCSNYYNPATNACCQNNPGCVEIQPDDPTPPTGCSGECCTQYSGYIVSTTNPAQYYLCKNFGVVSSGTCQSGQAFNLATLQCDVASSCTEDSCVTTPSPCTTSPPPCTTTTCAPTTTEPCTTTTCTPTTTKPVTTTTCTPTTTEPCTTTTCTPTTTKPVTTTTCTPTTTEPCTTTTCTPTTTEPVTTTTCTPTTTKPVTTTTCTPTTTKPVTTTTCTPTTTKPVTTTTCTPTTTEPVTTTTCTPTTTKPVTTTTCTPTTTKPVTTTTCTPTTTEPCTTTTCTPTTTEPCTTTTCTPTTTEPCTTTTCTPTTTEPCTTTTCTPTTTEPCTTTTCTPTTLAPCTTQPPCETVTQALLIAPLNPVVHVRPQIQQPQILPPQSHESNLDLYNKIACHDKPNGFMYASLKICNDYYICRNGKALPVSCGDKYFNALKGMCDLPENSGCVQPYQNKRQD
ncbi:uncharacterized protein PB18E9.04c-like [Teleopsis dalmanni]|uniref:uncharacterized protein PB18E9.04c-like n=1 Tax=Teleopsis dalmanni TaxID=139649 RepID=UPI0018CE1648|nr:uncharacterized protein PB18E9.04c-like [Teleopsis dalmanni]